MLNDRQSARKTVFARSLAAVAASVILAGCAMDEGGKRMGMGAMQDSPMHQMMQEMGCAHSPSRMQVMEKMTPEEKRAHMKSHVQECKAKMRQQAMGEAMSNIATCVQARMSSRHTKKKYRKTMHAMMMAEIRACASQGRKDAVQPTAPSKHDGH
ncbi:MAG: hypothetical protein SGJ03_02540 [Alphaproteobacteria bacterium]|nr:hypothetical protein [Alphaproteobacteria bacterium]